MANYRTKQRKRRKNARRRRRAERRRRNHQQRKIDRMVAKEQGLADEPTATSTDPTTSNEPATVEDDWIILSHHSTSNDMLAQATMLMSLKREIKIESSDVRLVKDQYTLVDESGNSVSRTRVVAFEDNPNSQALGLLEKKFRSAIDKLQRVHGWQDDDYVRIFLKEIGRENGTISGTLKAMSTEKMKISEVKRDINQNLLLKIAQGLISNDAIIFSRNTSVHFIRWLGTLDIDLSSETEYGGGRIRQLHTKREGK